VSLDARGLDNLRLRIADLRENIAGFDQADWDEIETKRRKADSLASVICVLVNHTRVNKSLLKSAALYDQIRVPDTTKVDILAGVNDTQFEGPIIVSVGNSHTAEFYLNSLVGLMPVRGPSRYRGVYVPRTGAIARAPKVGLAEWWEGLIGSTGEQINRRSVCSTIRSKDGIGHFDPVLKDQEYLRLAGYDVGRVWVEEFGDDTAICAKSVDGTVSRFLAVKSAPSIGTSSLLSTSGPQPVLNGVGAIVRQIAGELDLGLRNLGV
jgi:hypothetical protein